ncbi:MAG TPA: hypothetical protein VGV38_21675 [Pyrinomonadaceae bacterium]|nr:hypothetical protein [Pyrinomonadaceae bacterium]
MKTRLFRRVVAGALVALALGSLLGAPASDVSAVAQRRRARPQPRGEICHDPTAPCRTSLTFEPHDLPFRLPASAVIWETHPFYAVILKSMRVADNDCERHIPEPERLAAQELFPRRKVFASRCAEAGTLFYTNVSPDTRFMAVYAGRTRAEALRVLEAVRATDRFPGANLRQMRTGFNGT